MRRNTDIWDGPMNSDDAIIVLYTGQLIRPMAEFIYIVKNDVALYNTDLLQGLVPSVIGSQTILGYGDYANWLQGRVVESQDYINNNYWINDDKCYSKSKLTSCQKNCASSNCSGINCVLCSCPDPIEINFNSSYASTMFFIGFVDATHSDYTYKAEQIVTYFRNRVTEYTPNQSYTWFHTDDPDCYSTGVKCREDVSHGGIDIQIPIVAYLLYGNGLYQPCEMNKFTHTFTYNIWDRSLQEFHNNVFGTNNEITPSNGTICSGTIPVNGTQNIFGPGEVLSWMPLYPFDDFGAAPNDIYTVLITQTVKLLTDDPTAFLPPNYCSSITHNLSGAQSFYGLSEVTKAQWDKECINLTLFNRDVVYDQDFVVKNKLVVAPQQDFTPPSSSVTYYTAGVTDPFAEPKTFSDNGSKDRFVVESGTTVNMVAGESIELLPGFEAKEGSNFTASINPNLCTDGYKQISIPNDCDTKTIDSNSTAIKNITPKNDTSLSLLSSHVKNENNSSSVTSEISALIPSFFIYPNPTISIAYIAFTISSDAFITIKITDILGREIFKDINNKEVTAGNYIIPFDCSTLSKGVYMCTFYLNGQKMKNEKIILTH